ncbi:hypothetical protein PybrP1_003195 [[Pythium] brassicae (nom. inval.)]|nr:hypothetical protein PybrP1_003195 [[Pythium] brassicae (nom. inval.)]
MKSVGDGDDNGDAKAVTALTSKIAAPKNEKRPANHSDDTDVKALVRPDSGGPSGLKESKLKQPEVRPKILDKNSSKASRTFARAESKESGTSLHKVGSVQSLANEIRRIRSLRADPDSKPAEEKSKKPEKKVSARSKIKLEIAELPPFDEGLDVAGAPGRQQTQSPTLQFRPMSTSSPTSASSTGKRGISRDFVQGLGANFQLDLHQSTERLDKSFDLSASGTFDAVGFQIKQSGITRSPDRLVGQQPSNAKKYLVKLGVLGRGASGVVHKALHVPSLLLVAVKVIPVFENEKRHQLIAELKALYNNLSTLSDDVIERRTVACPEIVCLYDAFMNPNEGNVSIVVEYMDGGSLQDIVETGGCTSESVLANISYRMENSVAKATTFVGTLTYMSPERIASEEYSYKSDVWSFGLSIMTCALGRFPYSSKGGYWELLHMIRNEPPPRLPEGEFSGVFRDFLDKCLQKDQSERWSVKQLLSHEFVRHCERQAAAASVPAAAPDDSIDWSSSSGAKDVDSGSAARSPSNDEPKEQLEVDEIVLKVAEYCMKDAKELITEHGYSLDDIVAWIQKLPTMQRVKLARFADQIGASRRLVYAKFQSAMNELLQDIQELFFDDHKQSK